MAPKHLLFDAAALLLLLLPSGSSTTAVEYSKKGRDNPVKESGVEVIPDPVVRGEPATVKISSSTGNQFVHCQRVTKPEKEGKVMRKPSHTAFERLGGSHPKWRKVSRDLLAYAALARLYWKKVELPPPPQATSLSMTTTSGLSIGLVVHGGTSKCVELVKEQETKDMHSHFVSPWWPDLRKHPVRTGFRVLVALLVGVLWESIWLFILSAPYEALSKLQFRQQVKAEENPTKSRRFILAIVLLAIIRGIISLWITGKWVAVIFLALWEAKKTENHLWNVKINAHMMGITMAVTLAPFMFKKIRQLIVLLNGLQRRPSRRHGRHECTVLELSRSEEEP